MAGSLAQSKIFFKKEMMQSNINIRNATTEDVPAIQEIAFSTWPIAYSAIISKDQLHYMLDLFYSGESLRNQMNEGHTFIIADDGEFILGFASYTQLKETIYKLQKLYVLPGIQKSGAGKKLLFEVIRRAKENGGKKLQLNVNRHNTAIGFYEKMGFAIVLEDDINIGKEYYMNDYIMEKDL